MRINEVTCTKGSWCYCCGWARLGGGEGSGLPRRLSQNPPSKRQLHGNRRTWAQAVIPALSHTSSVILGKETKFSVPHLGNVYSIYLTSFLGEINASLTAAVWSQDGLPSLTTHSPVSTDPALHMSWHCRLHPDSQLLYQARCPQVVQSSRSGGEPGTEPESKSTAGGRKNGAAQCPVGTCDGTSGPGPGRSILVSLEGQWH